MKLLHLLLMPVSLLLVLGTALVAQPPAGGSYTANNTAGQAIGTATFQEGGGAFTANETGTAQGHADSAWSTTVVTAGVQAVIGAGVQGHELFVGGVAQDVLITFEQVGGVWHWYKWHILARTAGKPSVISPTPYDTGTLTP